MQHIKEKSIKRLLVIGTFCSDKKHKLINKIWMYNIRDWNIEGMDRGFRYAMVGGGCEDKKQH